jgi:hypothetical protein
MEYSRAIAGHFMPSGVKQKMDELTAVGKESKKIGQEKVNQRTKTLTSAWLTSNNSIDS